MSVAIPIYTGRAESAFVARVLATYGTVCHICGGVATTADHLVPRSIAPELSFDVANARPCCRRCNSSRGARPLQLTEAAAGW